MGKIRIIAAVDKNMAIGKGDKLLFHIKDDMKRFRELTMGKAVIMGRKTFESLPNGPLDGRRNIVLSKSGFSHDGVEVFDCVWKAILACTGDCFIIGGEQIYKETIRLADEVYLTEVDAEVEDADKFFPDIKLIGFPEVVYREFHDDGKYKFCFAKYISTDGGCPC